MAKEGQGPILGVRFREEHVLVLSVRREFTVFKWSELIKQCDLFLFPFTLAQNVLKAERSQQREESGCENST